MNKGKKSTKAHRHCWEIKRWISSPTSHKDIENLSRWSFLVEYKCSCGKVEKREPSDSELQKYVVDNICCMCGEFGGASKHQGERDCITSLQNKVMKLEDRLERMEDKFDSIRNMFDLGRKDVW